MSLVKMKSQGHKIDLLILTHVDDDHIAGILAGFKQNDVTKRTDRGSLV